MFDRPHYYVTIGGTQLGASETWQTGMRFAPDATKTAADLLATYNDISLSDIFDAAGTVIGNVGTGWRYYNSQVLKWAKLAVIGVNGHYAGEPRMFEGTKAGTVASSGGSPPQLALVATLGTGHTFGKAQRGRMYWPYPPDMNGAISPTTGQISQTVVDSWRLLVKNALRTIQGEVGTISVSVSLAVMSDSGAGTTNPVTQVGVGRIVDTQRRRRGDLVEATQYLTY
jgi:hypothetical protein